VCLAIAFVPVAPPRFLGGGIVDTAAEYGQSVYGGGVSADQLAAMPSVHVLWAVTIAWYAVKIGRSRWRFLAPLHGVLTVFVVVATGNHWWLDGVVAVAVLVVCAWFRYGVARAWPARHRTRRSVTSTVVELPVMASDANLPVTVSDGNLPEDSPASGSRSLR
jgi:hypothetical protein